MKFAGKRFEGPPVPIARRPACRQGAALSAHRLRAEARTAARFPPTARPRPTATGRSVGRCCGTSTFRQVQPLAVPCDRMGLCGVCRSRTGAASVANYAVPAVGGVGLRTQRTAVAAMAAPPPAFRLAGASLGGPSGDSAVGKRDGAGRDLGGLGVAGAGARVAAVGLCRHGCNAGPRRRLDCYAPFTSSVVVKGPSLDCRNS